MITTTIENFPGFPEGINGPELMANMRAQAVRHGTRMIMEDVISVDLEKYPFEVTSMGDEKYAADALIIASGRLREGCRLIPKKSSGVVNLCLRCL